MAIKRTPRSDKFRITVYSFYGTMQSWGFWIPFTYGQMFLMDYMGLKAAEVATIFLFAKSIDFFVSLTAGGIIQSANLKSGKFLPWMRTLRWVISIGAMLQVLPIPGAPFVIKAFCAGVGYCCMHCSMNFMSTCLSGVMQLIAGANMDNRFKMTSRAAQVSSASSIILSFGTVPAITAVGKLLNNEALGYTVLSAICPILLIVGVELLTMAAGDLDLPRDPNMPAPPRVKIKDMVTAIFTNDQMVLYMVYQVVNQIGTQIVAGMMMYYWRLIMDSFHMYSIVSGTTTCINFVFAMFLPKVAKKLGKKKSIVFAFGMNVLSRLVMLFFATKSIWWMFVANLLMQIGMRLTMSFGINYYLDIGEYGYYKTGKDFRTLSMSMTNIPMKISMAVGGAIGGYVLAWIGFDEWNAMKVAGTLDRTSAEWIAFTKTFMNIYSLVPIVFATVAIIIFFVGYKITDEDAKFYAAENQKKKEAERAAAAAK
ncbi:MAG: MFS transporter [Eubacteriaceae bacterium]|nr:MFS transporter [Eubacteriaceae bacterium]